MFWQQDYCFLGGYLEISQSQIQIRVRFIAADLQTLIIAIHEIYSLSSHQYVVVTIEVRDSIQGKTYNRNKMSNRVNISIHAEWRKKWRYLKGQYRVIIEWFLLNREIQIYPDESEEDRVC